MAGQPSDDANVASHLTAQTLQQFGQSVPVQLVWLVAKVLVTAFVSGSIAIGVGYVRDMRDELRTVMIRSQAQDKAQALIDQRVAGLERVSDATVSTLQQLGQQVTHNTDDLGVLREQVQHGSRR